MLACLENIIGVTQSSCPCLIAGLETPVIEKLKASKSGLFLDNLPGGIELKALKATDGCKSFADMALEAIDDAKKEMEDALKQGLAEKYDSATPAFNGMIGQQSFTQSLPVGKRYRVLRMRSNTNSDAVVNLDRITLIMNSTVTMDLVLYKVPQGDYQGQVVQAWEGIEVQANLYKSISVNPASTPGAPAGLRLPTRENGRLIDYYFIYDSMLPAPFQPKDALVSCGCSGEAVIKEYVITEGGQLDSLGNLTAMTPEPFAEGILINVTIRCDTNELFCREYSTTDAMAVAMARSIWYKAGELLIEKVLKSTNISRYTMMDNQYLWGKRNHFRKEFQDRVIYMVQTIDIGSSNCYICRQVPNMPFYAGIKS